MFFGVGKRRNEFAEWHVAWIHGLRNDLIMRNVMYAEWLNEINLTEIAPFWRQSMHKQPLF